MEKRFDVIALGELLIDFAVTGKSDQGNDLFEACPGGAPGNVLAMLNKLGKRTSFLGKIGDDQFGVLLRGTLNDVGIDTSHLLTDKEVHTTLAFVHTFPDGDRDFSFYRNPGADMMLTADDIDEDFIKSSRDFHFGTLSMTHKNVKEATLKALDIAKKEGLMISFDPNLRPPLWDSLDRAREEMMTGLSYCDLLKISDDESLFISGKDNYDDAIKFIQDKWNVPLILLTLGKDGSRAYYKGMKVEQGGFKCNTIETTGAGDTFCGCAIDYVLDYGIDNLTEDRLLEMVTFANAAAAIVTTKRGAIKSMPEKKEVYTLLNDR